MPDTGNSMEAANGNRVVTWPLAGLAVTVAILTASIVLWITSCFASVAERAGAVEKRVDRVEVRQEWIRESLGRIEAKLGTLPKEVKP